jgi:membrane-associated protein
MFALHAIIAGYGVLGITLIVFCETALPVCFFLPGDTLLFTGGMLAAAGKISLGSVMLSVFIGAFIGGIVGFAIGRSLDKAFLDEEKISPKLRKIKYRAERFYARYGALAVVLGRFVPLVRTLMSGLAGAAEMNRKKFYFANGVGAALWSVIVPSLGYFLGRRFPDIVGYMTYALLAVMVLSFVPILVHALASWRKKSLQTK